MTDVTAKLELLRLDFQTERTRLSAAALPVEDVAPDRCRYCGQRRYVSPTVHPEGHVQRLVGPEFKGRLATEMRDPRLTYELLSETLGATEYAIRAWYRAGAEGR